ncbi:MAG: phenylalanine 4-monooxygenase, partial [Saprospiraceae bacterium]|nr:phenylalanine 4-monooxygenase [Saprospiraceae bacterium]
CYSSEDHQVWKILFERQWENLQDIACSTYLESFEAAYPVLHEKAIPKFSDLNKALFASTGWTIEVTPGLIPVKEFLALLAERKFPSSTWLRRMDQLDYLEEPDMFHDIFGHVPMLFDKTYADFMHHFGKVGMSLSENEDLITVLERFYWFTVEFGMMEEKEGDKIFGAGILSSFGETNQIRAGKLCTLEPFDMAQITGKEFRKDIMQANYFVSDSLDQMSRHLDQLHQFLMAKKAA